MEKTGTDEIWNFDATTDTHYPPVLHVPYFNLYRKQVVKRADLVLAMHLRGDAFPTAAKARTFASYEALTGRDPEEVRGDEVMVIPLCGRSPQRGLGASAPGAPQRTADSSPDN